MIKAKARYGFKNIVVDDCPFCHRTHYHNHPVVEGVRMADCFNGEYMLDFAAQSEQRECWGCTDSYMVIGCPAHDVAFRRSSV